MNGSLNNLNHSIIWHLYKTNANEPQKPNHSRQKCLEANSRSACQLSPKKSAHRGIVERTGSFSLPSARCRKWQNITSIICTRGLPEDSPSRTEINAFPKRDHKKVHGIDFRETFCSSFQSGLSRSLSDCPPWRAGTVARPIPFLCPSILRNSCI